MWCNRQTPSPPGLWPVRGGSPFPVPSAHARLVDTAATTVAYHCFFFFPPKRAPGAGICETHLGINGVWLIAEFNV